YQKRTLPPRFHRSTPIGLWAAPQVLEGVEPEFEDRLEFRVAPCHSNLPDSLNYFDTFVFPGGHVIGLPVPSFERPTRAVAFRGVPSRTELTAGSDRATPYFPNPLHVPG